jgi:hypothetical protein
MIRGISRIDLSESSIIANIGRTMRELRERFRYAPIRGLEKSRVSARHSRLRGTMEAAEREQAR